MKQRYLILVLVLMSLAVQAQESVNKDFGSKYALAFVPQYVIMGGTRLDFDIALSDKTWLTMAPTFYYMDNSYMWDPASTSFVGIGAFTNLRYFPTGKGVYAAGGLNYRLLDVAYDTYGDNNEEKATFNTFGFDVSFGYQFRIVEQLFMDLYLGWGFRYSLQETVEDDDYWSGMILDLAYSGFLPVAGIRLGFEF